MRYSPVHALTIRHPCWKAHSQPTYTASIRCYLNTCSNKLYTQSQSNNHHDINKSTRLNTTPPQSTQPILIPPDKRLHLIEWYSSHPDIREYRHPRHLLSWTYWKQFAQQFLQGSKDLVRNAIQARKLLQQHRDTVTNQVDYNQLSRRQKRFIHTTKRDVVIGIPWVIWFALPVIGYTGIFAAHFLPHYLPGVYRSTQLLHQVRHDAQQRRRVLLYGLIEQLQHIYTNEPTNQLLIDGINILCRCIDIDTVHSTYNDIHTLVQVLQSHVKFSDLPRDHLRWLLAYLGDDGALNGIYPHCLLEYKLNIIGNDILVDDQAIRNEGIHTLTEAEIVTAAYYRGMPFNTDMYTIQQIKECLTQWLQLTETYQCDKNVNITLPATSCRFLSTQPYTNNKLLPVTVLHIGMVYHSIIPKKPQLNK